MSKHRQDGLTFRPKNDEQRVLVRSFENNSLTVCRSLRYGSGKTFCAIGYACQLLKEGKLSRVVFCRDSSEISDRLGYMPGTKSQKLADSMRFAVSYFRLFLGEMYPAFAEKIQYHDVADIAGETFCDSVMILDEASNCTKDDLLMFIGRAGHGSSCIILGTKSQMHSESNAFGFMWNRLRDVGCVGLVELKEVLRNGWMAEVLEALE